MASGMEQFRDRRDAGARLGRVLSAYARRTDVIVLGLPRGGVEVAYEMAVSLELPLDVLVVRKLGIPGYEEVAMGAIASGGIQVVDRHIMSQLGITSTELRIVCEREGRELDRREAMYRGTHAPLDVADVTAIVVDDGLASSSTMLAAITALRVRGPEKIVIAVPVGSPEICTALRTHVDDMHCLFAPADFEAVGDYYRDFTQLSDDDVRGLLERAHPQALRGAHAVSPSSHHRYRDPATRRH
jgi:predicted phosphoribosyltransferase